MASENSKQAIVYLSRTESFSASHRLHSVHLTDEDNFNIYGKCNNANGHGHNYKVEVTLRGPVDPVTGMLMNVTDLKRFMNAAIMDVMDHKNLDKDIPHFKDIVSTAENIAVFIWGQLEALVPAGLLYEVRLFETDKNVALYRGERARSAVN